VGCSSVENAHLSFVIKSTMKVKYIRTKEDEIIVFSELQQHSEFRMFNPVTAGFISIGAKDRHEPYCQCYGESISLKLKADEEKDTQLAMKQILGYGYF
jgi:hypothetical protein